MVNSKEHYIEQFSTLRIAEVATWVYINYRLQALSRMKEVPPVKERQQTVENITEACFEVFGRQLPPKSLDLLSDYMLVDYIKSPNKKQSDENKFLSDRQDRYRKQREIGMEAEPMDFFHTRLQWNLPKQRTTKERDEV